MERRFEGIEVLPRYSALKMLKSNDGLQRARALISLAYHDPDQAWVEDLCLQLAKDPDPGMRATAALCFGHLARIHRKLDLDRVLPVLQELRQDPSVGPRVDDVLDDIKTFLGK